MGSRFRELLTHWTDPAVFTQPDQWEGFRDGDRSRSRYIVHEKLLGRDHQEQVQFESNENRQWSDEFSP